VLFGKMAGAVTVVEARAQTRVYVLNTALGLRNKLPPASWPIIKKLMTYFFVLSATIKYESVADT